VKYNLIKWAIIRKTVDVGENIEGILIFWEGGGGGEA